MGSRHVQPGWSEERYPEPFAQNVTSTGISGSQGTVTALAATISSTDIYLVARDATFSIVPAVASVGIAATNVTMNIIDGVSGGATILWTATVLVSSTGIIPITVRVDRPSRVLKGPLTAEFAAGTTGAIQTVTMGYFGSK